MLLRSVVLRGSSWSSFLALACSLASSGAWAAQVRAVLSEQKVSETAGGFGGLLGVGDGFGSSLAPLGDLDGDGIGDLAVGAWADDGAGSYAGAVWILFLDVDGSVKSEQKISEGTGGFGGVLDPGDSFGSSVASLGDLDGDGIGELVAGAVGDDDGGSDQGAVWILFLDTDGSVKSERKISETSGGFAGDLDPEDLFGISLAALGDLDGDGIGDLAVGAEQDDDGVMNQGAVWVLFLDTDGSVKSEQKISETSGGFGGALDSWDYFGSSLASLGDFDGDGSGDLAVGARNDDDRGSDQGAVWLLFLHDDGTVKSQQKIINPEPHGGGALGDYFGWSVAFLGDLDGDALGDLAVGVLGDDDGGGNQGAVWLFYLNADGTVKSRQKISEEAGGFGGVLDPFDYFGGSVAALGDLDGDGIVDLATGAWEDDDGGTDKGAVWILFLAGDTTPPTLVCPPLVSVLDPKSGPPGEFVSYSAMVSDDRDPAPSVFFFPPSGSFFPPGTTMVTCMATDAAGHVTFCMFPVVVRPTIAERRL